MTNYKPGQRVTITYKGGSVHGGAVTRTVIIKRVDRYEMHTMDDDGFHISYGWPELTNHRPEAIQ